MSAEPVKDVPVVEPVATEPATTTPAAPVTEPVVDAKPTTDAAVPETTTAATTETPATATEATKEEPKAEAEPAAPVTEGTLGYKAPGLIKSLRFSKKYFWLGEEAIEDSALAAYLRGEKHDSAHANAAHASQTGKGLLLFAKRVEDRSSPSGILNLAEATDIVKEEPSEFSFKLHGQKHTFQANTKTERDGWLASVEKSAGEAATAHEGVKSSEGYKAKLEKFTKPAGALAPTAASANKTSPKPEDKVHDGTTPAANTAAATSEPTKAEKVEKTEKTEKSRSQSRKRQSIFGSFLNKAEEKKDIKKEERAEKKAEKEVEKEEKKDEKAVEKDEPIKIDEPVATTATPVVAPVSLDGAQEPKPVEETPAAAATTTTSGTATTPATNEPAPSPNPLKSKRGSVFGSFFKPSTKKEEPKTDAAPAVPAKDTEPVSSEAPQLAPVDTAAAPAATTSTTTPAAASESTAPVAVPTTEATTPSATKDTPATSSPKEKSGFLSFFKQKEAQHEAKKEEKKEEKVEKKEEEEAVKEAKKSEETPAVAPTATTPAAATATTPSAEPKDKRRSSFFGSLAGKKEKKSEPTSDAEGTDGEKKGNNLKGLFRKASRGAKPTTGPVTDSAAPPAAPAKDGELATDATAPVPETTGETSAAPVTTGETPAVTSTEPEVPAAEKPAAASPAVVASA